MPTRTIEQEANQIKHWDRCPGGHWNITGGPVEIDGRWAHAHVICNECDFEWDETYEASHRTYRIKVNDA